MAKFIRAEDGSLMGSVVTYRLEFFQLFPQRIGSQTVYTRGMTYGLADFIWGNSSSIASAPRHNYIGQIDQFVKDYKKSQPVTLMPVVSNLKQH